MDDQNFKTSCHGLKQVITHKRFEQFILIVIFLNAGFLASDHYPMTPAWEETLTTANYAFVVVYVVEVCPYLHVALVCHLHAPACTSIVVGCAVGPSTHILHVTIANTA